MKRGTVKRPNYSLEETLDSILWGEMFVQWILSLLRGISMHFRLCLNGGQCIDGEDNYTCACKKGFNGRHCEHEIDLEHFNETLRYLGKSNVIMVNSERRREDV